MIAPTLPIYTVVLIQYPDRTWSVEPILANEPGYTPQNAGPEGCLRRGRDLAELVHRDARTVVSAVLGVDPYGFDLRFCEPTGACVVRSEMVYGVPPGDTQPVYYELVYTTPEFRERVGDAPAD